MYQRKVWNKGDPITAGHLNRMESGVEENAAALEEFSQRLEILEESLLKLAEAALREPHSGAPESPRRKAKTREEPKT